MYPPVTMAEKEKPGKETVREALGKFVKPKRNVKDAESGDEPSNKPSEKPREKTSN